MGNGLSDGCRSGVTTDATSGSHPLRCQVTKRGWAPGSRHVALVASGGCWHVEGRFARRPPAGPVTGCTISRGTAKETLRMTGLAGHLPQMRPLQLKAGRGMIERLATWLLGHCNGRAQNESEHCQNNAHEPLDSHLYYTPVVLMHKSPIHLGIRTNHPDHQHIQPCNGTKRYFLTYQASPKDPAPLAGDMALLALDAETAVMRILPAVTSVATPPRPLQFSLVITAVASIADQLRMGSIQPESRRCVVKVP